MRWKNKWVLITGADGFIGSHLTEELIAKGAKVSVYVRGDSLANNKPYILRNIGHLTDKFDKVIYGDISSPDSIDLIRENDPDIIFHLAAEAFVPYSFNHPLEVKKTNLDGTLNVLHAAMTIDVERIVYASSSEVYGSHKEEITEESPLYPSSPYAASKIAADRYAFAYWNTYGLPIAIIRPFNTYGPRHTYDAPPKFINQALRNEPITIYGSGKQSRDLTYIDDMIAAFLIMGSDKKAIGQVVNFGTGKNTKIIDLAKKIINISMSRSKIIHLKERTSEVQRLLCDYSKARKLFNWVPLIDIDKGLRLNIEYERNEMMEY